MSRAAVIPLTAGPGPDLAQVGEKAATLAAIADTVMATPPAAALDMATVAGMASNGASLDLAESLLASLDDPLLFAVRASPERREYGGPEALLNLGATSAALPSLTRIHGARTALDLRRRMIMGYATGVLGLDVEDFENAVYDLLSDRGLNAESDLSEEDLAALVAVFEGVVAEEAHLPDEPAELLAGALNGMVKSWNTPSARIRRQARGASAEAGLALIVQSMAVGLGDAAGAGVAQFRDEKTGLAGLTGLYLPDAQGDEAVMGLRTARVLTQSVREAEGLREPSLEEIAPGAPMALVACFQGLEKSFGDAVTIDFTCVDGEVWILGARPARRTARAAVRIAVDMAQSGAISEDDALLQVDPLMLEDHLHPTVDPDSPRDRFAQGLPASPGAATGALVFSGEAAEIGAARGGETILVRIETSPEDIRGMHAANGVLTIRGGMTSHAAVVARGLGVPAIVGVSELRLDPVDETLTAPDGRVFRAGDVVTVDGSTGEALAGTVTMRPPEISGAFATLLGWADDRRRMGVRANADTAQDAALALEHNCDGIGLCRTEHMFFDKGGLTAMREMIMADSAEERRIALAALLPLQRAGFLDLFRVMRGRPVTIRLLDPPLHEFLPHSEAEMAEIAHAMGKDVKEVHHRAEQLQEFNPMLGMRGVRLGVILPEIYEMQCRAIFEAALKAGSEGIDVAPEIMVPLVSTAREVEVIAALVDRVAAEFDAGGGVAYEVGAMIETPRAALRGEEIARHTKFLSFGTNDMTQMTFGLSRDDAGRFMRDYIASGVLAEDPFHSLDIEGVGELVLMGAARGRAGRPDITIGLCGEHGGDPPSVHFCDAAGFDYVSCSPFRAPIARLAAAQATVISERLSGAGADA